MKGEARIYRLLSGPMINTPGLLRWAQNGYHFKRDRKALLRTFTEGYGKEADSPTSETFH